MVVERVTDAYSGPQPELATYPRYHGHPRIDDAMVRHGTRDLSRELSLFIVGRLDPTDTGYGRHGYPDREAADSPSRGGAPR